MMPAQPGGRQLPGDVQIAAATQEARIAPVERPIEEEIILEVVVGRRVLSSGILAYYADNRVLLPLGTLFQLLEFAIDVSPLDGRAEGWFLNESNEFFLDLTQNKVIVKGREMPLPGAEIEAHRDDIYVTAELFETWFPVKLEYSSLDLALFVTPEEPLPFQLRAAREERYANLGGQADERRYPRHQEPYRLVSWPALDFSSQAAYRTDGEPKDSFASSLFLRGNLFFADTSLFLGANNDEGPSNARIVVQRQDPDGTLLGPAKATRVASGDIFTPRLPSVTDQVEGTGAFITSFPLNRPTEFDRVTLRGDLPLGYDVELYRNGALLDVQRGSDDGRYEFVDVPLQFGLNVIRLVFLGPQGQRSEETQQFFVGADAVRPGETNYTFAFNQDNEDTIPVGDDETPRPEDGEPRLVGEVEHGLTGDLSLGASFSSIPIDNEQHEYVSLGIRASMLGSFVRTDAIADMDGGQALRGSFQTGLWGQSLLVEHEQSFDFESERIDAFTERRTQARLDGNIPMGALPGLNYSIRGELEGIDTGEDLLSLSNRLSAFVAGASVTNTLFYNDTLGGETDSDATLTGAALVSTRTRNWRLRGSAGYDLKPELSLSNLGATAEYLYDRDTTLRADISRELQDDQETTFGLGASRRFGRYFLGAEGFYRDSGELGILLSLNFSLSREPRSGEWLMSPDSFANSGSVSARAFIDEDGDGRFDRDEPPVPRVQFERFDDAATDEQGIAMIDGLPGYAIRNLVVQEESIEDPFLVPASEGVSLVPRPGHVTKVDVPLIPTGEVDGMVYDGQGEDARALSNVRLQLVNDAGEAVAETRSEFDGFYLFQKVPMGRYRLRIAPDQSERLGLSLVERPMVAIEPDDNIRSYVDLIVERS